MVGALPARRFDKAQMAFMEGAHGRDEADLSPARPPAGDAGAEVGHGPDDRHAHQTLGLFPLGLGAKTCSGRGSGARATSSA